MIKLLILSIAFFLLYAIWQNWQKADDAKRKKLAWQLLGYGFIGMLVLLVVTGRLHILIAAGAALLPYLKRGLPLLRHLPFARNLWKQRQMHSAGTVKTALITMKRESESGLLSGIITTGEFAGKTLEQLADAELGRLYEYARNASVDSILLLQAYLEQRYGNRWRSIIGGGDYQQATTSNSGMSLSEAYEVLGLEQNASLKQVLDSHKRLIQKMHPDRGGSHFLAAQINQAKDVLTQHLA